MGQVVPKQHIDKVTEKVLLQVVPGETALAFYKAKNPTDKPIIGISTYNVVPFEAGQYFNKIQVSEHGYESLFVNYFF